jgi:hypothetical protein
MFSLVVKTFLFSNINKTCEIHKSVGIYHRHNALIVPL